MLKLRSLLELRTPTKFPTSKTRRALARTLVNVDLASCSLNVELLGGNRHLPASGHDVTGFGPGAVAVSPARWFRACPSPRPVRSLRWPCTQQSAWVRFSYPFSPSLANQSGRRQEDPALGHPRCHHVLP